MKPGGVWNLAGISAAGAAAFLTAEAAACSPLPTKRAPAGKMENATARKA